MANSCTRSITANLGRTRSKSARIWPQPPPQSGQSILPNSAKSTSFGRLRWRLAQILRKSPQTWPQHPPKLGRVLCPDSSEFGVLDAPTYSPTRWLPILPALLFRAVHLECAGVLQFLSPRLVEIGQVHLTRLHATSSQRRPTSTGCASILANIGPGSITPADRHHSVLARSLRDTVTPRHEVRRCPLLSFAWGMIAGLRGLCVSGWVCAGGAQWP